MPVNKGLLISAAIANGLQGFLDAREKGDLQRQRQALADVEEQMKAAQLQRYQAQTALLPREQQLAVDKLALAREEFEDSKLHPKASPAMQSLEYKIRQDKDDKQAELRLKKEREDYVAELELTDPDKAKVMRDAFRLLELGLPTGQQGRFTEEQMRQFALSQLRSSMPEEDWNIIESLSGAKVAGVGQAAVPGSIFAQEASEDIDRLRKNNELTALKLTEAKHLTTEEASALGLPAGTTREAAWAMGVTPDRFRYEKTTGGSLYRVDTTGIAEPEVIIPASEEIGAEEMTAIRGYRKAFESKKVYQDAYVMRMQVGRLASTIKQLANEGKMGDLGSFVGIDQALIMIYNKLTDPDSVVRESEYSRTGRNLPTVNQMKGWLGAKMDKGGAGLTNVERLALVRLGLVYAHEAEVALLGEKQNEALVIEGRDSFIKVADVLGYRHTISSGDVIDTSGYTASDWETLFKSERDKPPPKIDEIVDVTASDFDLPKDDEAALRKIFSGFMPSLGAFSTDTATPVPTGEFDRKAVIELLPGNSPRP